MNICGKNLVLCSMLCLFVSVTSHAELQDVILVANNVGGTVSVIDPSTQEVSCTINVNPDLEKRKSEWSLIHKFINWYADWKYADDVAISPDGQILYVSRGSVGDVVAFAIPSMKMLWRTPVKGYRADHMALSKSGDRIFVSAITAKTVQVIETAKGEIVGSFSTKSRPHGIHFSPDEKLVYVGELKGDHITVADANTYKVATTFPFSAGVRPFDITHDGKLMFLQLSDFHGFLEFDLSTQKISRTIALPETDESKAMDGAYPKEAAHHGIVLSTNEDTLCIAGTVSNYVALVSRPELKEQKFIQVGKHPGWAINSSDGKYCVISNRGSDDVSFVSYSEKKEVKRIKVGAYPQRVYAARVKSICDDKQSTETAALVR